MGRFKGKNLTFEIRAL